MALFQKKVINEYLDKQPKEILSAKWSIFRAHFLNPNIQENIRNSKEEQYQEGFLNDLFVNVLGYTKNPSPNFNLTTELKNVKDGKKADGGIVINEKVLGVIELKGTNTVDLGKIETQAFGYKNNQHECVYVITSNFEKLRLYIDNAIEYIEFNLFTLSENEFSMLYLCLAHTNIAKNLPKEIKEKSLNEEDLVTKKLYQDYSLFKRELYENLLQLNPEIAPLMLFQKSQKLLDRFLFLFFAEDRQLLPANSVRELLTQWKQFKKWRKYTPLYEVYKDYFDFLNVGNPDLDVYPYNGGLFRADEILDKIKIEDDLLQRHTLKIANYDFSSEVDVNILGHIFENSLNELDEIKAQLAGEKMEKAQTKRKKDGVFYTPKYITKYIVENTVGKLCREQKESLQIREEEYFTDKKRAKKEKERLLALLQSYQDWLLQLTILDPACGSGAFLNEALNFLIAEHHYIDELRTKIMGGELAFSEVENTILENNLFGVDLNEESVEIAKLSLWLRTAKKGRKLNDLSNNIKCGNSLIDDAQVAGNKAFNWHENFPKIFEKGGFDVVIGNPPYGAKLDANVQEYLNKKYIRGGSETVISFTKLAYDTLLKKGGQFGFIIPKSFTFSSNYEAIRDYTLNDISEIIDCKKVWKEVLLEQIILFFTKNVPCNQYLSGKLANNTVNIVGIIDKDIYTLFGFLLNDISNIELELGKKINSFPKLNEISRNNWGDVFYDKITQNEDSFKVLGGAEIQRYYQKGIKGYVNENINFSENASIKPNSILIQRLIAHIENPTDHIKVAATIFKEEGYKIVNTVHQCVLEKDYSNLYGLCILNSNIINWYLYRFVFSKAIRSFQFSASIMDYFPIPKISIEAQQPFIEKADKMLALNKALRAYSQKFQQTIMRKFSLASLSAKLQKWYLLGDKDFLEEVEKQKIKLSPAQEAEWAAYFAQESQKGLSIQFPRKLMKEFSIKTLSKKLEKWYLMPFKDFLEEVEKQKIKLSLAQEAEWTEYFAEEKQKALAISQQIEATDKEIDAMVYALYGLTEEEIAIVEQG